MENLMSVGEALRLRTVKIRYISDTSQLLPEM